MCPVVAGKFAGYVDTTVIPYVDTKFDEADDEKFSRDYY